jgi:hypothetical protein
VDELRSCAAQDWRYQLKDGFPQRKNAALFDLTHKAKADPRALQSTQARSVCYRATPLAFLATRWFLDLRSKKSSCDSSQ